MVQTNGYQRAKRHYEQNPHKGEILRLWAAHVSLSAISRRLNVNLNTVSDIIHDALVDGEIEEIRIIHK